jgi:hypothetical protein
MASQRTYRKLRPPTPKIDFKNCDGCQWSYAASLLRYDPSRNRYYCRECLDKDETPQSPASLPVLSRPPVAPANVSPALRPAPPSRQCEGCRKVFSIYVLRCHVEKGGDHYYCPECLEIKTRPLQRSPAQSAQPKKWTEEDWAVVVTVVTVVFFVVSVIVIAASGGDVSGMRAPSVHFHFHASRHR